MKKHGLYSLLASLFLFTGCKNPNQPDPAPTQTAVPKVEPSPSVVPAPLLPIPAPITIPPPRPAGALLFILWGKHQIQLEAVGGSMRANCIQYEHPTRTECGIDPLPMINPRGETTHLFTVIVDGQPVVLRRDNQCFGNPVFERRNGSSPDELHNTDPFSVFRTSDLRLLSSALTLWNGRACVIEVHSQWISHPGSNVTYEAELRLQRAFEQLNELNPH